MDKTYTVRALFGVTTTTYDVAGEVVKTCDRVVNREEVEAALPGFLGEIQQVPPAYSAKKLGGKKAYELARQGLEVAIPASTVTVYSLKLVSFEYPAFSLECNVSSGFYVRSLVHDLGERLGVGATVEEVRRLRVGALTIEQAMPLDVFLDSAAAPAAESPKAGG
jgi:tRNA pseudouridine55 synthase